MRLGSVITVNPESVRQGYPYDEIEYIDISSVAAGELRGTQRLRLEDAPSRAKRIVRDGDTLLATVRPNLRSFWFAKHPKENTVASTGFAVLRPNKEVDPRFLYYTVASQSFTDYLTANTKGAAYPAVDTDVIERAEISVPSLKTQRKIAAILSAYDDLIENNLRRIKILEEMAENLYREWFVKFRFPGFENTRFVDSPLGSIPETWKIVTFTEIADVLSGGTPRTSAPEYWNGPIPFFAPKDAPESVYVIRTAKSITALGLQSCNSELYLKDTVFITARGTVGKVVMAGANMAMNQSCYALRGKQGISQPYLFWLTRERVDYLKKNTGGATFDTIVVDTFRRMLVVKPPIEVVSRFSQLVEPVLDMVHALLKQNIVLRSTRDLLLPRLISGELDVSELDIEVPEEVGS